jgi:hypothetical protein
MTTKQRPKTMTVGKGITFNREAEGKCVCGVHIHAGEVNGHPTVLHPFPTCETFNRFESPIDYLEYVNKMRRGS